MSVPSFLFLLFALIAAVIVNVSQRRAWRQAIMLCANVAFLASFAATPVAFLPLAGFVCLGYLLMRLQASNRRVLFWLAIGLMLIVFVWLKRYTFIPSSFFLKHPYVAIGVSYIFFRMLHLIIDSGQAALEEPPGPLAYLNYVLHFPCIVAGPIQMYPDYLEGRVGRPDLKTIARGIERIALGMVKVLVVSAILGIIQDRIKAGILNGNHSISASSALISLYPIYLYFNFSGYTDVVIGASAWLGQLLPENFDRPFLSLNFIEFWGRWHMSLSSWLRTYVYNPLLMNGMSRFPEPRAATTISIVAFFVTFFLVGVWHGQTSNFLFFGLLQGGGVAINKAYQVFMTGRLGARGYRALCARQTYQMVSRALTFAWFAFTLLWFWNSGSELHRIFAIWGPAVFLGGLAVVFAVAIPALQALSIVDAWSRSPNLRRLGDSPYLKSAGVACLLLVLALFEYALSAPPPVVVYLAF